MEILEAMNLESSSEVIQLFTCGLSEKRMGMENGDSSFTLFTENLQLPALGHRSECWFWFRNVILIKYII